MLIADYDRYSLGKANSKTFRSKELRERGYGFITPSKLRNSAENGIISSTSSDSLTLKDFLNLVFSHEESQAYSVTRSRRKLSRRDIQSVIDELVSGR